MSLVCLMSFFNIKKRKLQSFTVIVIVSLTMMLLISSLAIVFNSNNIYDRAAKELKTSNTLVYSDTGYQGISEATQYWEGIEGTKVNLVEYNPYSGMLYVDDDKKTVNFAISTLPKNVSQDKYIIVDGDTEPKPGEIWFTSGYAYANGIDMNDEIQLVVDGEKKAFKVTGIVVDPPFSMDTGANNEIFVSQDDWKLFATDDVQHYVLKLKLKDSDKVDQYIKDWGKTVDKSFDGTIKTEDDIKTFSSFQVNLSAIIMFITSLILIGVIFIVIVYSISSDIYSDYKNIGILMSSGYSSLKIRGIYVFQYLIIFLISAPIAIIGASKIVDVVMNVFLLKSLGFNGLSINCITPSIIVASSILLLIVLTSYLVTRKATYVEPVDIILMRDSQKKKSKNKFRKTSSSNIKNSVGILLSKDFRRKIGQTIFIAFMGIAVTFITLVIINLTRPMKDTAIFREYCGIGKEDLVLVFDPKSYDDIKSQLQNDERVKDIFGYSETELVVNEQNGVPSKTVICNVYGENSNDEKAPLKEGRNAQTENEIVITTIVSEIYDKHVGDTLEITYKNQAKKLNIVGISRSTTNGGKVVRVSDVFMKSFDQTYKTNMFSVTLTSDDDEEKFTEDYLTNKNCFKVISYNDQVNRITHIVLAGVNAAVVVVNAILWIILLIILFNIIVLNIIREKRMFGTLTVVGFSPTKTKMILILPIVFASLLGIIIGIVLLYVAGIPVMNQVYHFVGVTKCPFSISWKDFSLLTLAYLTFVTLASCVPTMRVEKISPRDLLLDD